MGHMNIKRIRSRVKEELYSTYRISKEFGLYEGYKVLAGKLDIQIIAHNGRIEHPRYRRNLIKKHEVMNKYFSKVFPLPESCKDVKVPIQNNLYKECIWVCWWQGLDKAPEIVVKCVESIQRNAGTHKVIVITDENVDQFVEFPEWIKEKYRRGIITKTHISDILRLKLLAQYGGVWLDATFFCIGSLDDYLKCPVWSIKRPEYRFTSVAAGYFANYSFGCDTEHRKVFAVLVEYLLEYWKRYDFMIDYLFLDYLIVQAQKQDVLIKETFKEIKPNNPNCDELLKILGSKFDVDKWNELKKETKLFKLTWKADFPETINGEKTFYGKLISKTLL